METNWPRLVQAGLLDSLASSGLNEKEILLETAAAICAISLSEPHRVEIAYKCIKAIVKLCSHYDLEVARQAVGALANLAEDVDTHEYVHVPKVEVFGCIRRARLT